MMDQLQTEWKIALEAEISARRRCAEAHARGDDASIDGQLLRDWWAAVTHVLQLYSRGSAYQNLEFPPSLAGALQGLAGHLAIGDIPDPIKHAAAEGRTGLKPQERRDIGLAVVYLLACKNGFLHMGKLVQISDKHPTKTVAELFQVKDSTVRKWVREVGPAEMGVGPVSPDFVIYQMQQAAERYRSASRSSASIYRRGMSRA